MAINIFLIFIVLNIFGIFTTLKILDQGGRERNPVIRKLIEWLKPFPTLVLSKTLMILAVTIASYRIGKNVYYLLGFGIGIYVMVLINNLKVLKKLKETFTYPFTHWGI